LEPLERSDALLDHRRGCRRQQRHALLHRAPEGPGPH